MRYLFHLLLVVICLNLQAQHRDSSYLDLGRTQLKKEFVQSIVIKGDDLEKFPHSNLADLISSWLYGMNTSINTLGYIVDGNMVADVNIYSIHDIEEIRLVQNAAAQLNGAFKQQQLIIIKTRKLPEEGLQIKGSGQTHLVQKKYYDPSATSELKSYQNLYHNYNVGARYHSGRLQVGASLGYLHDVLPEWKRDNFNIRSPRQINRYRFNTETSIIINNDHELSTRFNLTRQGLKSELSSTNGQVQYHEDQYWKDLLWNVEAKLKSDFGTSFSNELSAAYAANNGDHNVRIVQTYIPFHEYDGFGEFERNNFLARNTLRYSTSFNQWKFSPALNFSFRHIRYRYDQFSRITTGGPPQLSQSWSSLKATQVLLTPSVDLSYRNIFNLQAGILTDLSSNKTNTIYPYVSTAIDLLAGLGSSTNEHLKIFASYAKAGYFYDHGFPVADVYYTQPFIPMFTATVPYLPGRPDSGFYNMQLGTSASLLHGRLQFSYQFEKRDFISNATVLVFFPGTSYYANTFPGAVSTTHRIQLGTSIQKEQFRWTTNIHVNNIAVEFTEPVPNLQYHDITGDVETKNRSWAAAWNNRFNFNKISFGFDLAALLSKDLGLSSGSPLVKDLLSLQQAFVAYTFNPGKLKQAELFLSTRNALQNDWHAYTRDPRMYYGAGFKIQF